MELGEVTCMWGIMHFLRNNTHVGNSMSVYIIFFQLQDLSLPFLPAEIFLNLKTQSLFPPSNFAKFTHWNPLLTWWQACNVRRRAVMQGYSSLAPPLPAPVILWPISSFVFFSCITLFHKLILYLSIYLFIVCLFLSQYNIHEQLGLYFIHKYIPRT